MPGVPLGARRLAPERPRRLRVARGLRVRAVRPQAHRVPRSGAGVASRSPRAPSPRPNAAARPGAGGALSHLRLSGYCPVMGNGVLSPQVGTLDVFVELFSEIESETEPGEFYNRLCEALCRLTTMQRAVLMLYDESLGRVVAAGSHG